MYAQQVVGLCRLNSEVDSAGRESEVDEEDDDDVQGQGDIAGEAARRALRALPKPPGQVGFPKVTLHPLSQSNWNCWSFPKALITLCSFISCQII